MVRRVNHGRIVIEHGFRKFVPLLQGVKLLRFACHPRFFPRNPPDASHPRQTMFSRSAVQGSRFVQQSAFFRLLRPHAAEGKGRWLSNALPGGRPPKLQMQVPRSRCIQTSTSSTSSGRHRALKASRITTLTTWRGIHQGCRSCMMAKAHAEAAGSSAQSARDLLPTNVVPRHYHVTLEPDLEKFTFDGTVVVDLDAVEDSTTISFHTLELDLHSVSVSSNGKDLRCGHG